MRNHWIKTAPIDLYLHLCVLSQEGTYYYNTHKVLVSRISANPNMPFLVSGNKDLSDQLMKGTIHACKFVVRRRQQTIEQINIEGASIVLDSTMSMDGVTSWHFKLTCSNHIVSKYVN